MPCLSRPQIKILAPIRQTTNRRNISKCIERETHQRDFQTHYFIIGTTYQRDDVCDRQRDIFQNLPFRRAGRRASHAGSHVALDVASVVALVCGQSCDCRVCRRMPNRARGGVFFFAL